MCVHADSSNEKYTHTRTHTLQKTQKKIRWSKRISKLDKTKHTKEFISEVSSPIWLLFYGTQLDFHFTNVLCVYISFFYSCVRLDLFIFIALFFVVPFNVFAGCSATIYMENV